MELDVRGEMCPYPAMKTKETLQKTKAPLVTVITDHAPALSTVPWEGAKEGYAADIQESGHGEWRITLTKMEGKFDKNEALAKISSRLAELGQG